jgi:prepilin-type N-terminal cleavage/methylation domain-containing protein
MYKNLLLLKKTDRRGLSLVELLIVLALLGMIIGLGHMFFSFGTRTFNVGEAQSNVQQNVRVASNYITRELRYAFDVQIIDDTFPIPENVSDAFNYIFINDESALEHRSKDGSIILFGDGSSGAALDSLIFAISDDNDYMLDYSINASSKKPVRTYPLSTEVYLENLVLSKNFIKDIGSETRAAIRYINDPEAPQSLVALPKILEAGTTLSEEFTLNLFLNFAEYNTEHNLSPSDLNFTQGAGGSLSISAPIIVDKTSAELKLSGTVQNTAGIITIRLSSDAIDLDDNSLTATIIVIPPS